MLNQPSFIELAPMEGIVDHTLRELFAAIGGIDRCTTEFVRVSRTRLPEKVFKRFCPELNNASQTLSGVDVHIQLLGDDPALMAANAVKAATLGAKGISLNYGCPAKCVNNRGGGSVLLKDPNNLYIITKAVREAVPAHIPVTAKIRLGYEDKSLAMENAMAIEDAGGNEIAIHGRTKVEGYKPPAYWDAIGRINQQLTIPVVANGEMWNLQDIHRCINESGTDKIMLGRGLVACPDLALLAKGKATESINWGSICLLLFYYKQQLEPVCPEKYLNSLIKQWLAYLRQQYAEAHIFFAQAKRLRESEKMEAAIIEALLLQHQKKPINPLIGQLDLSELLQKVT